MRGVLASACLCLALAVPAFAQQPEPLPDPPATPQFLSRYDFHLSAAGSSAATITHASRGTRTGAATSTSSTTSPAGCQFLVDYQAVLGNEFRPFDPNQGNYTLGGLGVRPPRPDRARRRAFTTCRGI